MIAEGIRTEQCRMDGPEFATHASSDRVMCWALCEIAAQLAELNCTLNEIAPIGPYGRVVRNESVLAR